MKSNQIKSNQIKSNQIKLLFIALIATIGYFGCQKEQRIAPRKNNITKSNSFAKFTSVDQFLSTSSQKVDVSYKSADNKRFSSDPEFESISLLEDSAIQIISKISSKIEKGDIVISDISQMNQMISDSLEYKFGKSFSYTEDGLVTNVINTDFNEFINIDRVVQIEGDLYQFNSDNIKIIKGLDYSKVAILDSYSSTDSSIGIQVYYGQVISTKSPYYGSQRVESAQSFSNMCSNENGNHKILMYEEFVVVRFPYDLLQFVHRIKLRALVKRKALFTQWWDANVNQSSLAYDGWVDAGWTNGRFRKTFEQNPNVKAWSIEDNIFSYNGRLTAVPFAPVIYGAEHTGFGANNTKCIIVTGRKNNLF